MKVLSTNSIAKNNSFFSKILLLFGVSILLILECWSVVAADSARVSLTVSDRGAAFSLMQQTASSYFNISFNDLKSYPQTTTPNVIFPALYMAQRSNNTPDQIWVKHRGHGWGRLANQYGFNDHERYMSNRHRSKYRTVNVIDDDDYQEMMTVRFLNDYYGASPELIYYWHNQGLPYEDLFLGFNIGSRLHRDPRMFFQMRLSGNDWHSVARRCNVPYSVLIQPVEPVRRIETTKTYKKQLQNQEERNQYHKSRKHGRRHDDDEDE